MYREVHLEGTEELAWIPARVAYRAQALEVKRRAVGAERFTRMLLSGTVT